MSDATAYGPDGTAGRLPAPIAALLDNAIEFGEDYLNVNVWTPDPSASGLPVMVWIHGGAFGRGSNRLSIYNGDAFARDGVVLVRSELPTPGCPDSRVGGRRTGETVGFSIRSRRSSGCATTSPRSVVTRRRSPSSASRPAMSVASLLSSPLAQGLFGRAIMQSGNGSAAVAVEDARKVTARVAGLLGVTPRRGRARLGGQGRTAQAQTDMAMEMMLNPDPEIFGATVVATGMGIMSTIPVVDGDVLPNLPSRPSPPGLVQASP